MFNRYNLDVSYKGNKIFSGSFRTINKAIKVATFFNEDCFFNMYDWLNEKTYSDVIICNLIKEFKDGEIFI